MIENLKQEASKSEDKQQNEVSKLKLAVDKANEEIKAQRLQHDKEKTTLQDKFNQVHYIYIYIYIYTLLFHHLWKHVTIRKTHHGFIRQTKCLLFCFHI